MSDWASVLSSALDGIRYGIVLLDKDFEARFINRAYYRMFALAPPLHGETYHLTDLIAHARAAAIYDTGGRAMNDLVGRLDGEEVAIVPSDTDMPDALQTAQRLCRGVAAKPFTVDGDKLYVTVSIGVAARRSQRGDPDDLLRFADRALYAAKANGRNCVIADIGQGVDR